MLHISFFESTSFLQESFLFQGLLPLNVANIAVLFFSIIERLLVFRLCFSYAPWLKIVNSVLYVLWIADFKSTAVREKN